MWPARIRYHEPAVDGSRPALTIVDVVQEDEDDGEDDYEMATLSKTRHLVLGPWQGIQGFRETEVDLEAPPGFHLESWYTCALSIAGVLATKVPGRGRILMLGLGGGAIPTFFNLHYPGLAIEAVELDLGVSKAAERWFGLSCEPPLTNADHPGFELQSDEPRLFVPARYLGADGKEADSDLEKFAPSRSTMIRSVEASSFCTSALQDEELRYDAILVDVFTRGEFPHTLLSKAFFRSLVGLLKPSNPRASVIVNAGTGGDRDAVERLMRECDDYGAVATLMDGTRGTLEGDYENAVVVGLRKKAENTSETSLSHVKSEEWDRIESEIRNTWPDAVPPPFRLSGVTRGNQENDHSTVEEIMVYLDANPNAKDSFGQASTSSGAADEEPGKSSDSNRGGGGKSNGSKASKASKAPVVVADRDDPAFALFD
ncbi:hypothetical protein HDU96_001324 [Phlyctochytrium bullatum]|nr:hypothetical protein HDU96_001324 [Phlyctochytrium bullatum]